MSGLLIVQQNDHHEEKILNKALEGTELEADDGSGGGDGLGGLPSKKKLGCVVLGTPATSLDLHLHVNEKIK